MTNEEWERLRTRAIMGAFQTGRPVFADSEGELRYADGDREPVPVEVGVAKEPVPRATALAVRAEQASRLAFILSGVAAIANSIAAVWNPWFIVGAIGCGFSAGVWRRVNARQRDMFRGPLR